MTKRPRLSFGLLGLGLLLAVACGRPASPAPPPLAAFTPHPVPPGLAAATQSAETTVTRACNNREYLPAALALIRGARRTIHVSQFLFIYGRATRHLQDALVEAARRGVRVRVIVDEETERSMLTVAHLVRLGVDARADSPRKRTHTKMIVVDGERALCGSTNWSDASLERNNESNLLVADPALAAALDRYFEDLWTRPDDDCLIAPVTSDGITVLFDRAYETVALRAIAEADSIDLHLYAARWYGDTTGAPSSVAIRSVADRARAGRPVRAIVEESDYNEEGNRFNGEVVAVLEEAGVRVRRDPLPITSHTKLLITDRAVILGSTNWGFGAFRRYHELNFRIENPRVAGQFRGYYEGLWRDAQPEGSEEASR